MRASTTYTLGAVGLVTAALTISGCAVGTGGTGDGDASYDQNAQRLQQTFVASGDVGVLLLCPAHSPNVGRGS